MEFSTLLSVILSVFTNKAVIIATVAVILYLNFVTYVQHYHKKPPEVRKAVKKAVAAEAAGEQKNDDSKTEGMSENESSEDHTSE